MPFSNNKLLTPLQDDAIQSTPSHGRNTHSFDTSGFSSQSPSSSTSTFPLTFLKQVALRVWTPGPHNLLHYKQYHENRLNLMDRKQYLKQTTYRFPIAKMPFWTHSTKVACFNTNRLSTHQFCTNCIGNDAGRSTITKLVNTEFTFNHSKCFAYPLAATCSH